MILNRTDPAQQVTGWVLVGNEVVACCYPSIPRGRWYEGPPDHA